MDKVCPFCGSGIPDLPPGAPGDTLECPVCGQMQDRPVEMAPGRQAPAEPSPAPQPPLPPPAPAAGDTAALGGRLGPLDLEAPPIPWEGDRGFFGSLLGTIGQVLFHPGQAFAAPGIPGLAWPLAYALILGTLCIGGSMVMESLMGKSPLPSEALAWLVALSPVMALMAQFVGSWICHLCLMIVRGNKQGFQPTFRVVAYSTTTGIWLLIPWVGVYLSLVWGVVVGTEGLSRAHGISRGKAFWAWVMPYLFLLLVIIVAIAAVAGRMMGGYQDLLRHLQ